MMDKLLEVWVSAIIEKARFTWMLGAGRPWQPGEKLKLLFAGYNGTRNTGSDVRVEEILRQVRRILGPDSIDLSVMTQNPDFTRGYFGDARQVHLPDVFPPFLAREVPRYHGVVACEGSMFKSKFANALTTMMIGALGIASAQNKLSVGYGAEAGAMDPKLRQMCRSYCRDSLIITRNRESQEVLSALDVPTELGTDTAWTFEPLGPEYGRRQLMNAGWDGTAPVLAVCPINPFWWPVKPSLGKWAANRIVGACQKNHYRSIYFHRAGAEVDAAYERYLRSMSSAVRRFRKERRVFVVLAGMELLDADACLRIAEQLGGAPVFSSGQYSIYELVSILRACRLMLTSRYHAMVTSMPAGVASAGVTMDERIANLMRERGHEQLLLKVDEENLEDKVYRVLRCLDEEADAMCSHLHQIVARHLSLMARMGMYLEENLVHRYPDFPVRGGLRSQEDYLPPLSAGLRRLLESHG
jgi:polysaccharide pyruvyl transferase WcaK-like protein